MKTIVYKYEDMLQAGKLLNQLTASGSDNFRILAEIADILDSGRVCEETGKRKEAMNNVIPKTLQKD